MILVELTLIEQCLICFRDTCARNMLLEHDTKTAILIIKREIKLKEMDPRK